MIYRNYGILDEVNDHWTEFRHRIVGIDNCVKVVTEWTMEKAPGCLNQIGMSLKISIFNILENLKSGTLSDDIIEEN